MPSAIPGVYAITNNITKRAYVGSGKDVMNRKASHFWAMRANRHKNQLIQSDYDLYGAGSFSFELLYRTDGHRKAIEQSLIDSGDFAYNLAKKATGGGPPKTADTRRKLSKSHTGKRHSAATIAKLKARPAETNGGFIGFYHTPAGIYPSAYQAEDGMGGVLNFTTIKRWCRNPNTKFTIHSYKRCSYLKAIGEGVIGQCPRDLGFGFNPID